MDIKPFLMDEQLIVLRTDTGKPAKSRFVIDSAEYYTENGQNKVTISLTSTDPDLEDFSQKIMYTTASKEMARLRNEEGLKLSQIAELFNCDPSQVCRRIAMTGAYKPGKPAVTVRTNHEKASELMAMRENGWSLREIGAQHKLSYEGVRVFLKKHGYSTKRVSAMDVLRRLDTDPGFREKAFSLGSAKALADKYNIPIEIAWKILIKIITERRNGRQFDNDPDRQALATETPQEDQD